MARNLVEFTDNSIEVKQMIEDACHQFLEEIGGEMEARTKRNMDNLSAEWFVQQKNSFQHKVDIGAKQVIVGSPLQQAIWTEFGTGEYALKHDGRKGYWVYVKGSDGSVTSQSGGKEYTLQEAKQIVAMMRSDGLDAHYTKGQKAKRPLFTAFNSAKNIIINKATEILKGKFE